MPRPRVAASDAVFGMYCRRWGVPLIDGGTIRLPRLIGHSHAMDLILTGERRVRRRGRAMGLANRIVAPGEALAAAVELGHQLAAFPQRCLRSDRRSSYDQWSLDLDDALARETQLGLDVIRSGETQAGATRFADGASRHGTFCLTRTQPPVDPAPAKVTPAQRAPLRVCTRPARTSIRRQLLERRRGSRGACRAWPRTPR
ncbi:MAG: enoyl-CoA hydratase-related protein [Acidimicrobiales bacterium]